MLFTEEIYLFLFFEFDYERMVTIVKYFFLH